MIYLLFILIIVIIKIKQNGEMLTKPRRAIRDSSDSNTERARATRSSSGLEGGVHTT